jgi:hypothetical protein
MKISREDTRRGAKRKKVEVKVEVEEMEPFGQINAYGRDGRDQEPVRE